MKVKEKYSVRGGFKITTTQLVERGGRCASDRDGQIEALEDRVSQLTEVLAAVIDKMNLSDAEVLAITGNEWQYDLADDEG